MKDEAASLTELVPLVHKARDADAGSALKALLAILERERQGLEGDIGELYDDWFIETCQEWVVPYIGDLVGVRGLHEIPATGYTNRAQVANALRYRRRKGTATMLEQLARDATGWPAAAVEFFQRLATTQNLNHVRLQNVVSLDLRDPGRLDLLRGPFSSAARTVDVRPFSENQPRPNIPNVGLHLHRLYSYPLEEMTARPDETAGAGFYHCHPVGLDAPLFNSPQTEATITHLAEEQNAPVPLRRRALYAEAEAARRPANEAAAPVFMGMQPAVAIRLGDEGNPIPLAAIEIADLREWRRPAREKTYATPEGDVKRTIRVALDPVLGRLALPTEEAPSAIHVSAAHGFSSDMGGGTYARPETATEFDLSGIEWQRGVRANPPPEAGEANLVHATLAEAIEAWNTRAAGTVGAIALLDNATHHGPFPAIEMGPGTRLLVTSADWPPEEPEDPGTRKPGRLVLQERRAHVVGDVEIHGAPVGPDDARPEFFVDGILLEGSVRALPGQLGKLRVSHCTLVPPKGRLEAQSGGAEEDNDHLFLEIERSILGPIRLGTDVPSLRLRDCLVDADEGDAVVASGADVRIEGATLWGRTVSRSLHASNVLFTGKLDIERRQVGCIRYSFVPPGSVTPRRYRCQPDEALRRLPPFGPLRGAVAGRVRPMFSSRRYGDPSYGQLHLACAREILVGGDDGAEMGAFHHLQQAQREANLRSRFDEFLRFGLRAGIIYES